MASFSRCSLHVPGLSNISKFVNTASLFSYFIFIKHYCGINILSYCNVFVCSSFKNSLLIYQIVDLSQDTDRYVVVIIITTLTLILYKLKGI